MRESWVVCTCSLVHTLSAEAALSTAEPLHHLFFGGVKCETQLSIITTTNSFSFDLVAVTVASPARALKRSSACSLMTNASAMADLPTTFDSRSSHFAPYPVDLNAS